MSNKSAVIALIFSIVSICVSGISTGLVLKNSGDKTVESPAETEKSDDDIIQYVMYVGTNDKDTYKPEHSEEEAFNIVDEICLDYFDGYTLQEAVGSWKDEKDNTTHEYTIVCYFDDADEKAVYSAADDIIKALNQNTVLIEKNKTSIEYYSSAQ